MKLLFLFLLLMRLKMVATMTATTTATTIVMSVMKYYFVMCGILSAGFEYVACYSPLEDGR